MNGSAFFIRRPVATILLTLAIALPGMLAYALLPRAALPQVDFPTLSVQANLPGASPETMAATVATPLERVLGRIAGITDMTSSSTVAALWRRSLSFSRSSAISGTARLNSNNTQKNFFMNRLPDTSSRLLPISATCDDTRWDENCRI